MARNYRKYVTYTEIISQGERLDSILSRWTGFPESYKRFRQFVFTGCGSSLYLGALAAQVWNSRLNRFCRAVPASEFLIRPEACFERSEPALVFGVSRTGETTETTTALTVARDRHGLNVVPVTCYPESTLGRLSENTQAFPEVEEDGLVMTRSFLGMLAPFLEFAGYGREIRKLPALIAASLEQNQDRLVSLADRDFGQEVFLGTGPLYQCAREAALKLQEMTGRPASAVQLFEFRHGHHTVIREDTLLWIFTSRKDAPYLEGVFAEFSRLGATVLAVGADLPERLQHEADLCINLPWSLGSTAAEAAGLLHLAQLYAFFRAVRLGCNPDRPANLNRVVELRTW